MTKMQEKNKNFFTSSYFINFHSHFSFIATWGLGGKSRHIDLLLQGKVRFQAINIKIIAYSKSRFANFKFTMLTPKIFCVLCTDWAIF